MGLAAMLKVVHVSEVRLPLCPLGYGRPLIMGGYPIYPGADLQFKKML